VIFTTQNYEVVKLQFLLWSFETSRAIIIFASLVIGFIIGTIVSFASRARINE
ncbi:MAG: LapA family protein, partial [Candidatus Omnitrophica bacterium]|nr:LapA family protein [Candidatus Omnitrophota bacterium]